MRRVEDEDVRRVRRRRHVARDRRLVLRAGDGRGAEGERARRDSDEEAGMPVDAASISQILHTFSVVGSVSPNFHRIAHIRARFPSYAHMLSWHLPVPRSTPPLASAVFRWPLVVLLASIGLTAIAAVEAQRAVRSQRALAERALREYASFAAWSYAQHLTDTLNLIEREAIGAVNHGDNMHTRPERPDGARPRALPAVERAVHVPPRAHRPESRGVLRASRSASKTLDVGVNTHARSDGRLGSRSPDADDHVGCRRRPIEPLTYSPAEQHAGSSTR